MKHFLTDVELSWLLAAVFSQLCRYAGQECLLHTVDYSVGSVGLDLKWVGVKCKATGYVSIHAWIGEGVWCTVHTR